MTIRMEVWFSEEQAAIIHAARKRWGVWMSVNEARLRALAEEQGLGHILRDPAARSERQPRAPKD